MTDDITPYSEAATKLNEAVKMFYELADPLEIDSRTKHRRELL